MITQDDFQRATGSDPAVPFAVDALDDGTDSGPTVLGFLDDPRYLKEAERKASLAVLLVSPELRDQARERLSESVRIISVDDPRWHFFTLHNALAADCEIDRRPTVIAPTAHVHPSANVDDRGVRIGEHAVIEAGATIQRGTVIEDHAVIRAGAVIGTMGFEHKRTTRGIVSVGHDGEVRIGPRTEIGACAVVARGFANRPTVIGADCRIDAKVFIAHTCRLGDRVFMAGGADLAGGVTVDDDAWIGPSASITNRVRIGAGSRVAIGSLVLRDVKPGTQVFGNPARRVVAP